MGSGRPWCNRGGYQSSEAIPGIAVEVLAWHAYQPIENGTSPETNSVGMELRTNLMLRKTRGEISELNCSYGHLSVAIEHVGVGNAPAGLQSLGLCVAPLERKTKISVKL